MTRSWSALLGGAVVVALVATGCGGGGNQASGAPAGAASATSTETPCTLMFPSEVGEILGLESDLREVVDDVTCRYHFTPARAADAPLPSGETFIEVKVHRTDGRTAVNATRLAGQMLGGGSSGFEKVSGIGDEAWLAPMAAYLSFAKGDAGVEIDMRMLPGEREKTIRLAQLMASRLP